MQTEVFVTVCEICQRLLAVVGEFVQFPLDMVMPSTYRILVGSQIHIVFHNANVLRGTGLTGLSRRLTCLGLGSRCFFRCNHNAYALILKIAFFSNLASEMRGA